MTIGAAPDVPPNAAVPVKLPDIADTDAPGAPISGLTMLSSKRGPREEVEASDPASDNTPFGREAHDGIARAQDVRVNLVDHEARNGLDTAAEGAAERRIRR